MNKKQKKGEPLEILNTRIIPLSEIDENPINSEIFNMDKIRQLADCIESEGFVGAISVYKKPDGRYEISSGHRRFQAMKMLNRDTIPCIVYDMPDDIERGLRLLSSNINNREMGPMDWARSIKYYQDIKRKQKKDGDPNAYTGSLRTNVAEFFNLSEGQVSRYEALNKLIPELQEMVNNPIYPWNALARASILDNEGQKQLYNSLQKSFNQAIERDKKKSLIDLDNDIPHSEDEDQKKRDLAQNVISGQRILLEIKKIQNKKAGKYEKSDQEKKKDNINFSTNNADLDENFVPLEEGFYINDIEMQIKVTEEQSIDYDMDEAVERIVSLSQKLSLIKDIKKTKIWIEKLEDIIKKLSN